MGDGFGRDQNAVLAFKRRFGESVEEISYVGVFI